MSGIGSDRAAQAVPPSTAASSPERVIGVMTGLYRGFTGRDAYNVVVTDHRLIFARFNAEAATEAANLARAQSKEQGGGFLRQAVASTSAYVNPAGRYAEMAPDQILAESTDNFALSLSEITRIKVRTMASWIQLGFVSKIPMIRIVWPGGNQVFKIESPSQAREGAMLLKGALGEKVKTTILWV